MDRPLIGQDKDLAERLEDLHKTIGEAGYWLIGLHALAAVFHHYVLKDGTLPEGYTVKRRKLVKVKTRRGDRKVA